MAKKAKKEKKIKGTLMSLLSKISLVPMALSAFIIVSVAVFSLVVTYNKNYTDESLALANAYSGSIETALAQNTADSATLNAIIKDIQFGEGGVAIILDKSGNVLACNNQDITTDSVQHIYSTFTSGQTANISSEINGKDYYFGYTSVKGELFIAVGTQWDKIIFNVTFVSTALYVISIIILVVVGIILRVIIKKLSSPIIKTANRLTDFANGDITSPAPTTRLMGEIGQMTDALASMIATMQNCIGDIDNVLNDMAEGNLSASTQAEYPGDLGKIRSSLDAISNALTETMTEVARSSSEVRDGAGQLAEGSSTLSQNAVTQAAAVDEITSTVMEIAQKTEANNRNVAKALETVQNTNRHAEEGSRSMSEMLVAIEEIETSSKEIEQIMKVIDDIAFQTNILALNAAIEAARAGDAGKGFAVVADEVRNLAGKSADAAKETSELINKSIAAVTRGSELADVTSNALNDIVNGVEEISEVMAGIATANNEQAAAVEQISSGMENVNSAIHNTSATAEQSAAASEELSVLAVSLSDTVARFSVE